MSKILITGGSGFIGTNLINQLEKTNDYSVYNVDIRQPKLDSHNKYWVKCDVNDSKVLHYSINNIKPDFIIHLAAEADVKFQKLSDFRTNIEGVRNLCKIVNDCDSIQRVIFTSTQYVNQFHGQPQNDDEYYPYTVYGESKVEGEKIVRNFNLNKVWTIIRPTNVYGPYNDVYVNGLFKVVQKGYYFHPDKDVLRSYGYIGTVVKQICKILELDSSLVNEKTFYVGDEPIQLMDFVAAVHKNLGKEKIHILPVYIFRIAATIGEIARKIGFSFPMNKTRFINMVTPNPVNMEKTFNVLGKGSLAFDDRIKITINWFLNNAESQVDVKK